MYIVLFSSIIALLLTWRESTGNLKKGMLCGFSLITFLGCVHYDYGSDYMAYFEIFKDINSFPFNKADWIEGLLFHDIGWALLCYIFKPLGFFAFVAFLNIIQNIIVYNFIRREVPQSWWTMATFIYLFTTSFYLMSFSMMRQEFVMIIFLGLWKWIKNRHFLPSFIILYLCSFIHSSAIILLPFALWGYLPIKYGKILVIISSILLITFWNNASIVESIFERLIQYEDFEIYSLAYEHEGRKKISIGLGFIINLIPLFVSWYFLWNNNPNIKDEEKRLVSLTILGYLITPFAQIIILTGRLGMYFAIYKIAGIPYIYRNIQNLIIRGALISIYIIVVMYDYWLFFHSPVWIKYYTNFHTIFSQL